MAAYGPQKITDHLAAYEDTGLTPEQIQAQQQEIRLLSMEITELRESTQALKAYEWKVRKVWKD